MRDIKFRAWDKDNEVMVYSDDNPHDDFVFIVENDGLQFYYLDTDRHLMDTNSIRLQYTGLKDKNDTEIYEGDILSYESRIAGKRMLVVEWSQWDAMFIFGEIRVDYATKNSEVIGNIYERPELLEGEVNV